MAGPAFLCDFEQDEDICRLSAWLHVQLKHQKQEVGFFRHANVKNSFFEDCRERERTEQTSTTLLQRLPLQVDRTRCYLMWDTTPVM